MALYEFTLAQLEHTFPELPSLCDSGLGLATRGLCKSFGNQRRNTACLALKARALFQLKLGLIFRSAPLCGQQLGPWQPSSSLDLFRQLLQILGQLLQSLG